MRAGGVLIGGRVYVKKEWNADNRYHGRQARNGGMPGHRSGRYSDRDVFYSSYIQTYVNRDVTDMIPGVDKLLFADFIRAAACRAGQMLNVHDIAQDVGVSDDTAKRWLLVLEMKLIS